MSAGGEAEPDRPDDRRAWEVTIKPKGRRTLQQARRLASEVEDEVLGAITTSDRRHLLALLRQALAAGPSQPAWRAEEGD